MRLRPLALVQLVLACLVASTLADGSFTFSGTEVTASSDASGFSIETLSDGGAQVTIKTPGTYTFTGSSTNGNIYVLKDIGGQAELILSDLSLVSLTLAPITAKGGTTETRITLQGTNSLKDANRNQLDPKSVVDLSRHTTIGGDGTLTVTALNKNGIKCGGKLTIESGTIVIPSAVNSGILADDQLLISGGVFTLTTSGDAIKSSPDSLTAETAGDVLITGGTFAIKSSQDAISAAHNLEISGGTFDIKTLNGYAKNCTSTSSTKGLKATYDAILKGGKYVFSVCDDAIHANNTYLYGGDFNIQTGGKGVHANYTLDIGGQGYGLSFVVTNSHEGLEGSFIHIMSGYIWIYADDDGVNSAGMDWMKEKIWYGWTFSYRCKTCYVRYSGGYTYITAGGDGSDCNGNTYTEGDAVVVIQPVSAGQVDSAVDYGENMTWTHTGGTVFATGSKAMAEPVSGYGSSGLKCQIANVTADTGSVVTAKFSTYTVCKTVGTAAIQNVVFCHPKLTSNMTCTITAGTGTCAAANDVMKIATSSSAAGWSGNPNPASSTRRASSSSSKTVSAATNTKSSSRTLVKTPTASTKAATGSSKTATKTATSTKRQQSTAGGDSGDTTGQTTGGTRDDTGANNSGSSGTSGSMIIVLAVAVCVLAIVLSAAAVALYKHRQRRMQDEFNMMRPPANYHNQSLPPYQNNNPASFY